jgi:hypothetical protein
MGVKSSSLKPSPAKEQCSDKTPFENGYSQRQKRLQAYDLPENPKPVKGRSRSPIVEAVPKMDTKQKASSLVTVCDINLRTRVVHRRRTNELNSIKSSPTLSTLLNSSQPMKTSLPSRPSQLPKESQFDIEDIEKYEPYYCDSSHDKRRNEGDVLKKHNVTRKLHRTTGSFYFKEEPVGSRDANDKLFSSECQPKSFEKLIGTKTLQGLSKVSSDLKPKLPVLRSVTKEEPKTKQFKLIFRKSFSLDADLGNKAPQDSLVDKSREAPKVVWRGKFGKLNSKF